MRCILLVCDPIVNSRQYGSGYAHRGVPALPPGAVIAKDQHTWFVREQSPDRIDTETPLLCYFGRREVSFSSDR
jgi:hypothetical protein